MNYVVHELDHVLTKTHLSQLLSDTQSFSYGKPTGRRTDVVQRHWMNQFDIPSFVQICNMFDGLDMKQKLGSYTSYDYTNCRTRIELCKDSVGSYLHDHADDTAKVLTLQLYLTDAQHSTNFNNKSTVARANCAWFFHNTGQEIHRLDPLEQNRISIIVNYVNENWRDESVLCTSTT